MSNIRITNSYRSHDSFLTEEDKQILRNLGAWCHFGEMQFRRVCCDLEVTCIDDMDGEVMEYYMEVNHTLFSPIPDELRRVNAEETNGWRAIVAAQTRKKNAEQKKHLNTRLRVQANTKKTTKSTQRRKKHD